MQKPMNAQLSTTLGLGLLVISTVGTPGLEPSSKYFEIEFVNLWWNRLVGFRLKPKFGSLQMKLNYLWHVPFSIPFYPSFRTLDKET